MKKMILLILFIFLSSSFVMALNKDKDVVFWLQMDDIGHEPDSNLGTSIGFDYVGVLNQQSPIPPYSIYSKGFDGIDDVLVNDSATTITTLNNLNDVSLVVWINIDSIPPGYGASIFDFGNNQGGVWYGFNALIYPDGRLRWGNLNNGDELMTDSAVGTHGSMYTFTKNSTICTIWVNTTLVKSGSCGTFTDNLLLDKVVIGGWYSSTKWLAGYFDGEIDEMILLNKSITESEILILFNESLSSIDFIDPTPPSGTTNNTQISINVNCCSGNVSLWFDANSDPSTLVINNKSSPSGYTTSVVTEQTYYYKASCDSGIENTTTRTWTYDISKPSISMQGDNFFLADNSTITNRITTKRIDFIFTDNNGLYGYLLNITNTSGNEMFSETNTTLSGINQILNKTIDISTYPFGEYNFDLFVTDSHTDNNIDDYFWESIHKGIRFVTPEGNEVEITSTGQSTAYAVKENDRYRIIFDFQQEGNMARVFNIEANGPLDFLEHSNYTAHFVMLNRGNIKEGNWLDFETQQAGEPNIVKIQDNRYRLTFPNGNGRMGFNSIGGLNTAHKSYSFNLTTLLPSNVSIWLGDELQFNYSGELGTANVSFNITKINEIISQNCNCSNCTILEGNCLIPVKFYSSAAGTLGVNLTNASYEYGIDKCSTFEYPIINITYKDTVNGSSIDVNNFYDLTIISPFTQTLQGSFIEKSKSSFCARTNISQINYIITGTQTLNKNRYGTQIYEYSTANHLIGKYGPTLLYDLYLAKLANTSTIIYTWRTNTFENINGIMKIFLCEGNGTQILLGTSSIINGEAAANLELLIKSYSYQVIYEGVTYVDTKSYSKCHIETETTRQYIIKIGDDTSSITGLYSIDCNITKTGNFSFLMDWGTNPENEETIVGCVNVLRQTVRGATVIHEECSNVSGVAATVADSGFDYIVKGRLYQGGYSIGCSDELVFQSSAAGSGNNFGIIGVLSIFILIIGTILLFSNESPKYYPIMGVVGIILAWILGILAFGWVGISSLVFFVIIIILIGRHGKKQ